MHITLCALIWIALVSATMADPAPARIAVISNANSRDFAALVTTELSSRPDVGLVERDDLAKVGDELKLQQMAGSDAVALGKLIGADGLLFIDKSSDGLHVRFTAVGLGYALFDDQTGSPTDLPQLAKSIAHRVTGYVSKLKLDPAKAVPISVLNLRADFATADSTVLERKLTLLLESRLASLPEDVVLERRHAWSLGFEHALSATAPPLLPGAYVVDGTLSFPLENPASGEVVVHLRVRSPANQQTPLDIHGSINDPAHLVEQMTSEIRKATGDDQSPTVWDSQKEAREYLMEGIWGSQHGANDAALEALDSAELLGETAPDLIPIRIGVLFNRAKQQLDLAQKDSGNPTPAGATTLDPAIDDLLRAIPEAARYDAGNMAAQLQLLTWQQHVDVRTDQIKENLSNLASVLLAQLEARQSPRADELRKALRAITGYDPLHGKLGRADMSQALNVMTDSRGEWDLTLAEELAYFHLLCTRPHQFIPHELLTGQGKGFCQRFLKTPEEQQQAFDQLVRDLKDDPHGQLAYHLIRSCSADETVADAAYTAYWKEMWNQRESLVTQKFQVEEWTSARPVPEPRRQKHAREMLPFLHYYLTHVNNYRYWEYSWETMWQPEQWTEADAATIWPEFLAFKQRSAADRVARGHRPLDLSEFEAPFQKKFPQIAIEPTSDQDSDPLVIDHLWRPELGPETSRVILPQWQIANHTLWTQVSGGRGLDKTVLVRVSLPDFQAKVFDLPESARAGQITASSDAVYLYHYPRSNFPPQGPNCIARFDCKTETWEVRPIDLSFGQCYAINNSLYFDLRSGIERYDWDTARFTLLASARRKPARNQFDDCDDYQIMNIFSGPEGRPCVATLQSGTYYVQDQPGNWTEVFDSSYWTLSTTHQEKTIVYSPEGEAVLLDPAQSGPQYLMSPTQPHYRKVAAIHHNAGKEQTPWAALSLWDNPGGQELESHVGGDETRFFLLHVPGGSRKSYELIWYDKDHGRTPHLIPLRFVLNEKNRILLPPAEDKDGQASPVEIFGQPGRGCNLSVGAFKEGICLNSDNLGIWFILYRDIEAYLKTHATQEPSSTPPEVLSVKIPPPENDAQSQVIGDMIDPGDGLINFR